MNLEEQLNSLNTDTTTLEGVTGIGTITVTNSSPLTISEEDITTDAPIFNLDIPSDLISLGLLEGDLDPSVIINEKFVKDYFEAVKLYESIGAQLDEAKTQLKRFIEENELGSVSSNGMKITFTPATTTTTLDSAKLKSRYPEIAAECSKVSSRKSSISIKEDI